ncbi:unnamed protein product [Cunninghamella blakesleeana]
MNTDDENDISIKSNNNYSIDNNDQDSDDSLLSMGDLITHISTQPEKAQKRKSKGKQRQYQTISLIDDNDDNDNDNDLLPLDQLKEWESDSSITEILPKQPNKNKKKEDKINKETRAIQKKLEKQAKDQAKLEAKRLKEFEKEQKQLEKEKAKRVQQVNRLKVDRFEVIKEMIVIFHDPIFCSNTHGQLLLAALNENNVQYKLIPSKNNRNKVTLKWQRKTKAAWDKSKQQFIPFEENEERILNEHAAFLFLQVEEFIEIIQENDIDTWIDDIKSSSINEEEEEGDDDSIQLFLMIEGLEAFYKKKTNWQRRKFASRVLENMNDLPSENSNTDNEHGDSTQSSSTTSRKRKRNNNSNNSLLENSPSRTEIEEKLTYLQVMKDIMLIISTNEEDSVDWMISLTADLARSVYYNITTADFYKSQAPAKTGTESKDIWSKMLQEVQLCTPAVAKSIIEEYPTLMSLHKRYNQLNQTDGEYLLANLEVERSFITNRDRTINKFMSKKIHTIFTSDDPTDFIV